MSAIRYTGQITIRVTYVDARGAYRCALRGPDNMRHTIYVTAPVASRIAVDSSEAFDYAARAAVAFADDEQREPNAIESRSFWCDLADYGCSVIAISRKAPSARK
jgi:hypothetical protein